MVKVDKRAAASPGEKALGEGRDEGYLNQEIDDGFNGGEGSLRVAGLEGRGEEASSVERGQTDDACFILAGVPVKVVSEMLGHASSSITLDVYQHVLPDVQRDAARTMQRILTPHA